MTTINELILQVSGDLLNDGFIRWSKEDLVVCYNSAVAALATYRPDLFTHTVTLTCVAGAKQAMPAGSLKLMEVERNTGGRKTRFIPRGVLDDLDPDWICGEGAEAAEAYCYEESNPGAFWLYPGVVEGVRVDVVLSALPAPITTDDLGSDAAIQFDAAYVTPCMDWMIFRAYLKDSDNTANSARGQLHLQAFAQFLGVKIKTDSTIQSIKNQKYQANQG
jgi:hypothetical protein